MANTITIEEKIRQKSVIDDVYLRISKANIPIDRNVIVEKFKEPVCILPDNQRFVENDYDPFYRNMFVYDSEMSWHNSSGLLHSFNGEPSRILWNIDYIEMEWHKNGEPYRKNFNFNKVLISSVFRASETFNMVKGHNLKIEFQWLNKKGKLHSFNDMPASIGNNSIIWCWNGENQRKQQGFEDLPCSIDALGNMTFKKNKDDVPEIVRFPMSSKHYGKTIIKDLRNYEKYVQWPIRDLLTM